MRKKIYEKRKKFITNTYMREAIDYDIVIEKHDSEFITIKKYNKMSEPFILKNHENKDITYLDDGYYLLEVTPINEKYNIRFYYNTNIELIDYYVDITYENSVQYKMPYYVDLYLDILHHPKDNSVVFADEDELKDALDNKKISKKDYEMAYKVGNKLLKEIQENKNKYINANYKKLIKKYFG